MNIYSYSFFDLEKAEMVSGLTVARSKKDVLCTLASNGYKGIYASVRKMHELRYAIEVDGLGAYRLNTERLKLLSREILFLEGSDF